MNASTDKDRHDTNVVIHEERIKVSFIPSLQSIVYTSMDNIRNQGSFKAANGWIGSKTPADFILIEEILDEMSRKD